MKLGRLYIEPLSVEKVIADRTLDKSIVGVHGLLFYGKGCQEGEFLLLAKPGPFDGVGPIPLPDEIDRSRCLLINQPELQKKLGSSGASGDYIWKCDTIVIGQISHHPGETHPIQMQNLWLMLLQDYLGYRNGKAYHGVYMVFFSEPDPTLPPWNERKTIRSDQPAIIIDP